MNGNELLAALPVAALSECWLRRLDAFSIGLIEHAAGKTPPELSQRLREEWLADLAGRSACTSRLRLAVGCWWAAHVIAREWAASGLAAVASRETVVYGPHTPSFLSRRGAAILLIASLHLILVWLLALGMERKAVRAAFAPIAYSDVPDTVKPQQPPPLPPVAPRFRHTRIETVAPDLDIEAVSPGAALSPSTNETKEHYTVPAPRIERVIGGPGEGFPNTADYYPDASRRLAEKGVASVRVCVDGAGKLTAAPSLVQSSGHARLDAGALTLARAGSGHYRPSFENGQAVSSCFPFRIRFEFRD